VGISHRFILSGVGISHHSELKVSLPGAIPGVNLRVLKPGYSRVGRVIPGLGEIFPGLGGKACFIGDLPGVGRGFCR